MVVQLYLTLYVIRLRALEHKDDELSQIVFRGISSSAVEIVPLESVNVPRRIERRAPFILLVPVDVPSMVEPLVCSTGDRLTDEK